MISLQCQSCGGILEFNPTDPKITCLHCGAEYLRTDSFVQEVINEHIRLQKVRDNLELAIKTDNYAMQYKCLRILYQENQVLDEHQLILLGFYNILAGSDVTIKFLNKLTRGYCDELLDMLENIPDTYNLGNKPISKLALEFFLKAYRDNNYSNPFKNNSSMAKTKTHKQKRPKVYLIFASLFAGISLWVLLYIHQELVPSLVISLGLGLFVYFIFAISRITDPLMRTPCQSPGLPKGSMLYCYQDGFVITRNNKPDIFLFQGISRVFLQSSGVLTFLLGNQTTSVTILLPDLDAVDIQRLITFANTKIRAMEADFSD